ncbi:MAG: PilN domain-containing protein [Patescibacteria group bacterium]
MINLLPYENKAEIRAGRMNILLVRYIAILVCAGLVLGGLVVGSYVVLNNTRSSAQVKVVENQQRVSAYQTTKSQADSFRTDLTTAKTILDSSVSFSKLIYKIAAIVPSGVILDGLTLDPQTFGSSVNLTASAKSFDDASKLRDAFIKNDQIFTNVQLQSIRSSDSGESTTEAYPVKVSLTVVINKGATQ